RRKSLKTILVEKREKFEKAYRKLETDYQLATKYEDSKDFYAELDHEFQGKIYCNTCHEVHQWNPDKAEVGTGKPAEGNNSNSFLRISNNEDSRLCKECHRDKVLIKGTNHDLRVSAADSKNSFNQIPSASGLCGPCHAVHNASRRSKLWARKVSADKKSDLISRYCGSCHSKGNCAENKPFGRNSHSLGVSINSLKEWKEIKAAAFTKATGTEEEEDSQALEKIEIKQVSVLPMYTFRGYRDDENGRIYCSTCHNVHQWNPDTSTPGTGVKLEGDPNNSFLRETNNADSKLCTKCHTRQKTVIGTDHDLRVSYPDLMNSQQKLTSDTGVCSACHTVHNATTTFRLWARKPGSDITGSWNPRSASRNNLQIRLCTSCHAAKGAVPQNLPPAALHNSNLLITHRLAAEKKPKFPYFEYSFKGLTQLLGISEIYFNRGEPKFFLYLNNGKRSLKGNIVCPTCHEVHQWSAREKAPGKKVRGNLLSSFLRPKIAEDFCSDCHGVDSIYLYSFYHSPRSANQKKAAASGKTPHNRKPGKTASAINKCGKCHQEKRAKFDKHPIGITLKGRKNIQEPDNKKTVPLLQGKIVCQTCHDLKAIKNKTYNPNFLRGEFYTANWQNRYKRRLLSSIRGKGRLKGAGGGFSMSLGSTYAPAAEINKLRELQKKKKRKSTFMKQPGRTVPRSRSPRRARPKRKSGSLLNRAPRNSLSHFFMEESFYYLKTFFNKILQEIGRRWWNFVTSPAFAADSAVKPGGAKTLRSRRSRFSTPYSANYRKHKKNKLSQPSSKKEKKKKQTSPAKKYSQKTSKKIKKLKIKDESLGLGIGGFSLEKGKIPTVRREKGENQSGPRRSMIPKIDEEIIRLRRMRVKARRKFISKTKDFAKPAKGFFISGVITKWSSNETNNRGPNRYSLCYQCHLIEKYRQFSPHKKQINENGSINKEMCLYCHTKVPDRESIEPMDFKLRGRLEKQCINCHPGFNIYHPAEVQHYGQRIPKKIRKRIDNLLNQGTIFIPTKANRLVCSSCHNPHEKGVNFNKLSKRGADERSRLRFFGYEVCNACHKDTISPGGSIGMPF
ncbi:MAG: hypothetical protein ACE5GM_07190, partial [bacterium]